MSKKKEKAKPVKQPMAHKPKVKRNTDGTEIKPFQYSSYAQEIAVRALRSANPQITAPPLPQDQQKLVEGLINTLPAVSVDPEARVDVIYAIYRRNRIDIDPVTEQRIEEGRFHAHTARIIQWVDRLPAHERPQDAESPIASSLKILGKYEQLGRLYAALGVEDKAGFDQKIRLALAQGQQFALEKQIESSKREIAYELNFLARDIWTPDKTKQKIVDLLDVLGDNQHRVFPEGINSRKEMDAHIDEIYDAIKIKEAERLLENRKMHLREVYGAFGRPNWRDNYENPDKVMNFLQTGVDEFYAGDFSQIAGVLRDQTSPQVEEGLKDKHSAAMHLYADIVMRDREHHRPRAGWASESSADYAQKLVDRGYYPQMFFDGLDPEKQMMWQSDTPPDAATLEQIKIMAAQNEAIRFALATKTAADKGEPYGRMCAKTLACVDALGGVEALDVHYLRAGINAVEWADIKTFLSSADAVLILEPVRTAPMERIGVLPPTGDAATL